MLTILIAFLCVTDGPADDLKLMEGNWVLTALEFRGESRPEEKIKSLSITIKNDNKADFDGGRELFTSKIHLDASAEPKAIDLTRERDNQTVPGIYKLEGDTLTLCTAAGGGRPKDFSTAPDSYNQLRVYKRKKPTE